MGITPRISFSGNPSLSELAAWSPAHRVDPDDESYPLGLPFGVTTQSYSVPTLRLMLPLGSRYLPGVFECMGRHLVTYLPLASMSFWTRPITLRGSVLCSRQFRHAFVS